MDHKLLSVGHRIGRRNALEIGLCLALAPRIALAQTDPTRERPREGDVLVTVGATPPKPLKPEDLPLDVKQTFSWPMDPRDQHRARRLAAQQGAVAASRS